jgi:hypothetical protein
MTALWIGAAVYVIGSAADVYTTKRAVVDNPTRFHEGNAAMAPIVERWGWTGLAAVKMVPLAVLICVAMLMDASLACGIALAVLGGIFGFVAYLNRHLIRSRR